MASIFDEAEQVLADLDEQRAMLRSGRLNPRDVLGPDGHEGALSVRMARELVRLRAENIRLVAENRTARPLLRAWSEWMRGYCCPKCNHVLLTDQHVESMRGKP